MLLQARAMSLVAMILQLEPDPRAMVSDAVLGAAVKAAAGLGGLLNFRYEAATGGDEAAAEKTLAEAAGNLQAAAEEINALFEMAARLRSGGSTN
jgi:hypothetical protein